MLLKHSSLTLLLVGIGVVVLGTAAEARMVLPREGRFLSPDRAGMIDGPNQYIYAMANPVMFTDPSGMSIHADFTARFLLLEAAFTYIGNAVISALSGSDADVYVTVGPVEQRGTSFTFGITTPAYRPRSSQAGPLSCPAARQSEIDVTVAPQSFFDVNGYAMGQRQSDTLIHELVHADEYVRGLPHSEFDSRGVEFLYRRERGAASIEQSFWLIANQAYFPRPNSAAADLALAGANVLGRLNGNRSTDPNVFDSFEF